MVLCGEVDVVMFWKVIEENIGGVVLELGNMMCGFFVNFGVVLS